MKKQRKQNPWGWGCGPPKDVSDHLTWCPVTSELPERVAPSEGKASSSQREVSREHALLTASHTQSTSQDIVQTIIWMNFHVIQVGSPLKISVWGHTKPPEINHNQSRNASETAVQFTARTQKLTVTCLQDRELCGDRRQKIQVFHNRWQEV